MLLQAQEQRPHLVVKFELDDSLVVVVFRVRENLKLNARSLDWILENYERFEHFIPNVLEQLVGGTAGKPKSRFVLLYLEPVREQFAITGGPDSQKYHKAVSKRREIRMSSRELVMNYRYFFSRPTPHGSRYEKSCKKAQEIKMRPFFVTSTVD